jgi:predicted DNA-binding transcriptional regulator AlpA
MTETRTKKSAAKVAVAKKGVAEAAKVKLSPKLTAVNQAAIVKAGLAADSGQHQHDRGHVRGARAPPFRLLDKNEVCAIANVTFPTVWAWMRASKFPRARIVGGKSMWRSDEIEAWLAALPVRPLKGDTTEVA